MTFQFSFKQNKCILYSPILKNLLSSGTPLSYISVSRYICHFKPFRILSMGLHCHVYLDLLYSVHWIGSYVIPLQLVSRFSFSLLLRFVVDISYNIYLQFSDIYFNFIAFLGVFNMTFLVMWPTSRDLMDYIDHLCYLYCLKPWRRPRVWSKRVGWCPIFNKGLLI